MCPAEPDGPAVTEPALSWVMFDIIVSCKISAYRFTTQYSRHILQVDQIIIWLELTEVNTYRQVLWAAWREGTDGQIVWAGWATVVSGVQLAPTGL